MVEIKVDNINLQQIATSGQAFRWNQLDENSHSYSIVAYGKYLEATQTGTKSVLLDCTEADYLETWERYFDLRTDYEAIQLMACQGDARLYEAAIQGYGIRPGTGSPGRRRQAARVRPGIPGQVHSGSGQDSSKWLHRYRTPGSGRIQHRKADFNQFPGSGRKGSRLHMFIRPSQIRSLPGGYLGKEDRRTVLRWKVPAGKICRVSRCNATVFICLYKKNRKRKEIGQW